MKKFTLYIFAFVLIVSSTILLSRSFRVQKIPNGNKSACANCHVDPNGGGTRNDFGVAVEALVTPGGTQDFWSEQLASLDSDGDGFSNGVELQDPNGTWRPGQPNPGDNSLVTNPGDPNSKPNPTSVDNIELPTAYKLLNNYPNPFNPSTRIAFEIPQQEQVTLNVYSINGELIRNLIEENLPAGRFERTWDGKDNSGHIVTSGIYIYRLTAGSFDKSARMILMK